MLSLSQNGGGMKTVIGHLQCLIFCSGIGINNFLSKDVGIYCNVTWKCDSCNKIKYSDVMSNPCVQSSFLLVCEKHGERNNHMNSSHGQLDLLIDSY